MANATAKKPRNCETCEFYDYDEEERIEVPSEHYSDKEIKYLYVEDGILYIEIDNEEEI